MQRNKHIFLTVLLSLLWTNFSSQIQYTWLYDSADNNFPAWYAESIAGREYVLISDRDDANDTNYHLTSLSPLGIASDSLDLGTISSARYTSLQQFEEALFLAGMRRSADDSLFLDIAEVDANLELISLSSFALGTPSDNDHSLTSAQYYEGHADFIISGYESPISVQNIYALRIDIDANSLIFFNEISDDNQFFSYWGVSHDTERTVISTRSFDNEALGLTGLGGPPRYLVLDDSFGYDTLVQTTLILESENSLISSDDGFLASGVLQTTSGIDLAVFSMDDDFEVTGQRTIQTAGSTDTVDRSCVNCLIQDADGNILLASTKRADVIPPSDSPNWIRVIKLNSDMDIIWDHSLGGDANYFVRFIEPTSNGGFLIGAWRSELGNADVGAYFIKFGGEGLVTFLPEWKPLVQSLGVYPNPSYSRFIIGLPKSLSQTQVQLYDAKGQKVDDLEYSINESSDKKECIIDLKNLSAGVYSLYLVYKTTAYNAKLLKR